MFMKILCVLLIFLFISCNVTEKPKTDGEHKASPGRYSIEAPEGWIKIDTTIRGMRTTVVKPLSAGDDDRFTVNANILSDNAGSGKLDYYIERNLEAMQNSLDEFKKISEENVVINNIKFKRIRYTFNYYGNGIEALAYIAVYKGKYFIITCSALEGTMSFWEKDFEKIAHSFIIY
jgi:hypothetical protein